MAAYKLAALVEEFDAGTPAVQLVDRFLAGMPRAGRFEPPLAQAVVLHAPAAVSGEAIDRRGADFGLSLARDLESAVRGADAVLVVPRGAGQVPAEGLLEGALRAAREGTRIFAHGLLARSGESALRLSDLARERRLTLVAGSYLPATWRLPPVDAPHGAEIDAALIVVAGEEGEAELLALDGLLPVIERRRGGEAGVRRVEAHLGGELWKKKDLLAPFEPLLAAALSRSDTPQGDALKDGRTQDLLGLGLVPGLAREPVLYRLAHGDGLATAVFVLNGVVADINFAARLKGAGMVSAQLYRPPSPASHHFSALAELVHDYFAGGEPPWPAERAVLAAGITGTLRRLRAQGGGAADTPELSISYTGRAASTFRKA